MNRIGLQPKPVELAGYDEILVRLAHYAVAVPRPSGETLRTAGLCLADSVGCAIAALGDPDCARRLGPWVPGQSVTEGVPVWGTDHVVDPIKAAHDIGVMIRWQDFSDTTFVGGHPSDNLGAILAAADFVSRQRCPAAPLLMADVYAAMVGAYEIQGLLAADNKFDDPAIGLDHVIGVKLASTAMATRLFGGDAERIAAALSNAVLDGHALNAYRQTPNAGPRKGWAGGDAAARGVCLALNAVQGESGYPTALSAPVWGFEAVYLNGAPLRLSRSLRSFVLDHVIFKLHPVQRNASTAVESALRLNRWMDGRIDRIKQISIFTQSEALRRVNKTGLLPNSAARDHSIQYAVAVALLRGRLIPDDYSDESASDPRIEWLRERTSVLEDVSYSRDHYDLGIRSCANAIQIELDDGALSPREESAFPIGDPSRRADALPMLMEKFHTLTRHRWSEPFRNDLLARLLDADTLQYMPVPDFMDLLRVAS